MHLRLFLLVCLSILFSACQKETPFPGQATSDSKKIINAVEKQVAAAKQEFLENRPFTLKQLPTDAVELPAGSTDGLAAAIAEAGSGGTVLVKAGEHYESGTVLISHPVRIIGEAGAVIHSGTRHIYTVGAVQPALHVLDTRGVLIYGLDLRADSELGGTAILIQNAPQTTVAYNKLKDFGFGIVNQHGDHSYIYNNTIVGSSAWLAGPLLEIHGIININGDRTRIFNNEVSNTVFGIWACDESGLASGNTTNGNFIGLILCKVPTAVPLPDGSIAGSENAATNWIAHHNKADGNFHVGLIVIDGANNNLLVMNEASRNTDADVELAGDSERFGFLTPTSFENKVISPPGISIKDCGVDNDVVGGELVDTETVPCY